MKRILKPLMTHALIFSAILVAFVLLANAPIFDESLRPQIAERQNMPASIDADGNAYVFLMGLRGDRRRDPMEAGRELVDLLVDRADQGLDINFTDAERDAAVGASDEDWRDQYPAVQCNSRTGVDCLAKLVEEIKANPPIDEGLRWLLDQHDRLLDLTAFEEGPMDAATPLPSYHNALHLGRIALATSLLSDRSEFFDSAARQMRFWRLLIADGRSIIAKMVGVAGARDVVFGLANVMHDYDLSPAEVDAITGILEPLSQDDIDISEAIWAEHQLVAQQLRSQVRGLRGLISQDNATVNAYFDLQTKPDLLIAQVSPDHLVDLKEYSYMNHPPNFFNPYNIGGRMLMPAAVGIRYGDYVARMHDLNGVLKVAQLIADAEKTDADIRQLVARSGLTSPYTDEPISLDEDTGLVGFACYSARDNCRLPAE